MMAERPLLEAINVSKSYSRRGDTANVLSNINLAARPGEIVGLQGPSGCGKSTLLRLLMSIEKPTSGEIRFDGQLVTGPRRDGFVMPIFQNAQESLDPRWPIWRSVTEPLVAVRNDNKPNGRRRRDVAADQLARVGLQALDVTARPRELSGGQCQRLAILRALIASPRLIVADEPTSALDVSVAAGVLQLLSEVAASGVCIVIASHDRHALGALCHRTLSVRNGVIDTTELDETSGHSSLGLVETDAPRRLVNGGGQRVGS